MVDALTGTLATMGGVQTGMQLLGMDPASRAMQREQRFMRRQQRRRNAFLEGQNVQGLLGDINQAATDLPRASRRRFESGLASFAQEEQSRISEALAQAGISGASDTAARQQRALGQNVLSQQLSGEQALAQQQLQINQSRLGAIGQAANLQFPSAGQISQQMAGSVGQYVNPMGSLQNTLLSLALMGDGAGGGGAESPILTRAGV